MIIGKEEELVLLNRASQRAAVFVPVLARSRQPIEVVRPLVRIEIIVAQELEGIAVELVCARCLDSVVEEISRDFDLFYRPMTSMAHDEELHLHLDDTEIAFFEGDGLFLADILAEQVNLAIPMKVICRSDCRGLCPHCGANLNNEECRCEKHASDSRLAPLARLKQDWFKKQ